jgi:hypothetical protein
MPASVPNVGNEEQEEQLLAKLPYAESATFNHCRWQGESQCLAGTRSAILSDILSWARGAAYGGGQRIFWLDGMAGTGKSTIARTVARRCSDEGRLGASFFFSRGGGELETARTFVTTIAVQLAQWHPLLRSGVCEAVRTRPDIARKLLGDQWRQLVLGPCERLAGAAEALPAPPPVIVIDALDECKAPAEIEFVLELLSETSSLAASVAPLRIFLTSRPEVTVRAGLHHMSGSQRRHVILHRVEPSVISRDISIFFEHSLAAIIPNRPLLHERCDEEVVQRLVKRADGLFIWAATACRFIKEGGPHARRRLDMLTMQSALAATSSPERKLDEIYTSVLHNALREQWTAEETTHFCHLLSEVLGTITVMFLSLSAPWLAHLLSRSEVEVFDVLCDLHSILDIPVDRSQPIRPHHASVRDFLLSDQRCADARFRVDECQAHTRIARHCLQLMTKTLKKDICGINDPGVLVKDVGVELIDAYVPPSLRYACLYWGQHVQQSQHSPMLLVSVHSFMHEHLLHWFEVLALIGKLTDGIETVALLCNLFVSTPYQQAGSERLLTSLIAGRQVSLV